MESLLPNIPEFIGSIYTAGKPFLTAFWPIGSWLIGLSLAFIFGKMIINVFLDAGDSLTEFIEEKRRKKDDLWGITHKSQYEDIMGTFHRTKKDMEEENERISNSSY